MPIVDITTTLKFLIAISDAERNQSKLVEKMHIHNDLKIARP